MGALANQAAGPDPLAVAVYQPGWTLMRSMASETVPTMPQVDRAIAQVDMWLVPMKDRDRRFNEISPAVIQQAIEQNPETAQMVEAIKMIGRKIRPDFSKEQADHFVGAVVASLTDLPPYVAVQACKAALHRPFEFPGQVETGIRKEAERIAGRIRLARSRLESLRAALSQPAGQPLALPSNRYEGRALTPEGIAALPQSIRELGLTAGFLIKDGDDVVEAPEQGD